MAYKRNRFGSILLKDDKGKEFTITKKEQQQLKTYVKRANQRRLDRSKSLYNDISKQRNMKGISQDSYRNLLEQKGFITEKYSTKMNQFRSKEDFKDLMKELKKVTKRGYGDDRLEDIRKSTQQRLIENYGKQKTVEIRDILQNMSKQALLSLYLHNDEIVRIIYGSDIDNNQIDALLEKTESDINYYLTIDRLSKKN